MSELYDEVENFEDEKRSDELLLMLGNVLEVVDFFAGESSVVDGALPVSNEGARSAEKEPNSFTGSIFVETFLSLMEARMTFESSSSFAFLT